MRITSNLIAAAHGRHFRSAPWAAPTASPRRQSPTPPAATTDVMQKHGCRAQNACKGQGGCKTDAHACKGQNACKGQGGCHG